LDSGLELDEFWSDRPALTPALSCKRARARVSFSHLREKVAGDSRPDEGLRRDSDAYLEIQVLPGFAAPVANRFQSTIASKNRSAHLRRRD
jgi:hypothetical protein